VYCGCPGVGSGEAAIRIVAAKATTIREI